MKAWLITWEWMADAAAVKDKVVGILNSRKSPRQVAEIVEFMYSQATSRPSEMALYSKGRRYNPYQARIDFTIQCGHHPWLLAELVSDLSITIDPETGLETISWLTQGVHTVDNSEIRMVSPPRHKTFTRTILGAISNDLLLD